MGRWLSAVAAMLASLSLAAADGPAVAQGYPSRPVKIIVPFPAGGSNDIIARIVAQKLSDRGSQPFVVENRGGAGGNIGANAVATADPDGHTLLLTAPPPLTTNVSLYKTMLDDGRLRERTLELSKGRGLAPALAQVAREATRAARLTEVPLLTERAMEMSEMCDVLRAVLLHEVGSIPRGAVWVAEAVTVFELLLASRAKPAGLVFSGAVSPGRARTLVELIGVPAVCDVSGIYNWASDGDVALVDGDHGLVRVNPSRRERDEARVERADTRESEDG